MSDFPHGTMTPARPDELPLKEQIARDGYVAPIRVISEYDAGRIRGMMEAHEEQHGKIVKPHSNNPHLLFRWAHELIRSAAITDRVAELYGEDLLVWGSSLFMKQAHHPGFVSWHQDSTYWGLDPADVITAWIAISDSKADNGALCVVPGSHLKDQVEHRDTFNSDNMLSRGQEIACEVKPEEAVCLELEPGEMSLHHVRMIHGSGPNLSARKRIGFAVRYMPTSVRQRGTIRDTASLARGVDKFGHFDLEHGPQKDFDAAALAHHAEVEDRVNSIILG